MKHIITLIIVALATNLFATELRIPDLMPNPGLEPVGEVVFTEKIESIQTLEELFDEKLAPFYHGVASGDPLSDAVIIWTRLTPESEGVYEGDWKVATDVELNNVVQSGKFSTDQTMGYTVKIDVIGLQPNTVYYYGFSYDGKNSLTGRTRTAPAGSIDRLRFAVVSCASYNWGYFNAYARIAERNDLFAIIHLGDYFYEYGTDGYYHPDLVGREAYPENKCVSLDDYRNRFSQYRLDPDLRRAHQQLPMIAIWDDHESANDSWRDGAENHKPQDGDWNQRMDASTQAYFEWMPIREINPDKKRIYRNFMFGNLLELFMTETRLSGRDKPLSPKQLDGEVPVLEYLNPSRRIIDETQFNWLVGALASSQATWKLVGSSVMFMQTFGVGSRVEGFGELPVGNMDAWDGYPVQRALFYGALLQNNVRNFGVLSGDFHTAFGAYLSPNPLNLEFNPVNPTEPNPWPEFDKEMGIGAFGFEFTTPSVTSANLNEFGEFSGIRVWGLPERDPVIRQIETLSLAGNPHAKYINLTQHGYIVLDVASSKLQGDFYYVTNSNLPDTLIGFPNLERSNTEMFGGGLSIEANSTTLTSVETPATSIPNPPQETPLLPPGVTGIEDEPDGIFLKGNVPNPASEYSEIQYVISMPNSIEIKLYDMDGNQVLNILDEFQGPGVYAVRFSTNELAMGNYIYTLRAGDKVFTRIVSVVR